MTTQETADDGREITPTMASHWPVIVSIVACLCLLWAGASPLRGAETAALERSAKAAYLHKFAGALRHGVAINLIVVGGRVRFDVALDTVEKNGLRLSSRLLALAHVRGRGR